ncbi:nucleoside hydrolase [Inquilinus sp. OTU3971]|uniref:nucleoside hydrolase n=1 Tax=Inquilinus sp. OTU3971 TaxID=3043855 RepID=UPI00313DE985
MAETRRIIIDTDPGQDDAIAILLAMGSPELEIAGLTTVAGNVPLHLTTANALKLCELAGRTDIPVVQGSIRPLVRPLVTAEAVHGKTGLDGSGLPDPATRPVSGHAVDWIVDTIMAAPEGTYTLCPLGPLTNIAAALVREPKIAPRIREIVFMGGGFFEGGNTTPAAEFNIYVDPHAAHVVLTSGIRLTMVPLDVTHKALTSRAWLDKVAALGTPAAKSVHGMLSFYERFDMDRYGIAGAPLHDPCVIAYLLKPELFGGRDCHVAVELAGEHTLGMTVVDWWDMAAKWNRPDAKPKNCRVLRDIDADGFFELIYQALRRL